jgi:hypothetical protein
MTFRVVHADNPLWSGASSTSRRPRGRPLELRAVLADQERRDIGDRRGVVAHDVKVPEDRGGRRIRLAV